ncbi:hypothetical protein PIB30_101668, partial [Stylosanthes scabra]|nr:hypothetical protein [Stylosanthes scabra]
MEESTISASRKAENPLNHGTRKKVRTENLIDIDHTTSRPEATSTIDDLLASYPVFASPSQSQTSLNSKNKRKVGHILHSPFQDITNITTNPELN